eukprot:scaffold124524_cov43-Prasinocladus_malaysianus.AAC.1
MAGLGAGPSAASGPDVMQREDIKFEIMGVDDDKVQHLVLKQLMTKHGYNYTQCTSSEACLELLAKRKAESGIEAFPAVVLMDIMMPGISGLDCTRKIRDLYDNSPLPIIMVTTMDAEEGMCEGIEAGCNDYITKPFQQDALLSRIRVQINLLQRIKLKQGSHPQP